MIRGSALRARQRFQRLFFVLYLTQGCRGSNPGLELANAFGVRKGGLPSAGEF